MSKLSEKYNCSEETIKMMIKNGVISCSIPFYEEVIYHYKTSNSMQKTADQFNITKARVWQIVHEYKG